MIPLRGTDLSDTSTSSETGRTPSVFGICSYATQTHDLLCANDSGQVGTNNDDHPELSENSEP